MSKLAPFVGNWFYGKIDPIFLAVLLIIDGGDFARLPVSECGPESGKFLFVGFRPLKDSGRLAQHLLSRISSHGSEGLIDIDDSWSGGGDRLSLGNQYCI